MPSRRWEFPKHWEKKEVEREEERERRKDGGKEEVRTEGRRKIKKPRQHGNLLVKESRANE